MLVLGCCFDACVRSAESRSIHSFEVDAEAAQGQRREFFTQEVWLNARSHERAENHVAARPRETIEVKISHLLSSFSPAAAQRRSCGLALRCAPAPRDPLREIRNTS